MAPLTFAPPFTTTVLENSVRSNLTSLLPATCRTKGDHIVVPQPSLDFLEGELLVDRIDDVINWLWICGRPIPPRPLHHQLLLQRALRITERPGMHLVWSSSGIFLKPIPLYLLDPAFWAFYILPSSSMGDTKPKKDNKTDDDRKRHLTLSARGFLFSYTALVAYESDFRIAVAIGLLPAKMTWSAWQRLTTEVLQNHCFSSVTPRYWYGELRLSRLNKVYRLRKGFILSGYAHIGTYTSYREYLNHNFGVLGASLAYVVIVLTAMQVGLATEQLQPNSAFQRVSYGFTVFSILAPLVAGIAILVVLLVVFIYNWRATNMKEIERFRAMGVERHKDRVQSFGEA